MIEQTTNAEQIQILYEIAFGFDNNNSIKVNLKNTLFTILRRLNCASGSIFKVKNRQLKKTELKHFISVPKFVGESSSTQSLLQNFNNDICSSDWKKFVGKLPMVKDIEENNFYYILALSEFGVIILEKKGTDLTHKIIKSLQPVLNKIGDNCLNVIRQSELEQQRQRLNSLYQNVPICLFRSAADGALLMINPAGRRMFGYSAKEDLSNLYINDFYLNESDRYKFFAEINRNSIINNFEVKLKKKNGKVFTGSINTKAYKDEDDKTLYFEGSIEDITKRKQTEIQLTRAKEEAEKSEKLQSEFLAQISHEIRTPINTILSFISILEEEFKKVSTENSSYSFSVIKNSTYRLLRTIDLVLLFSSLGHPRNFYE